MTIKAFIKLKSPNICIKSDLAKNLPNRLCKALCFRNFVLENKIKAFRAKVTAIFRPTITICLLAGLLFISALILKEDFKYDVKMLEAFLILEVVFIPFIGLLLLAATFDYKITVYEDGISSYDPFGTRKCDFMSWDVMKKLRIRSVFGYRYYFIESDDSNERLWIPKNIKNKAEFAELVQSQVGIEHPLSIELMRVET
jgi:hypothetical protein